jgi:type II secretory ATPase GspE/PulE/Tfp pilus assembly ATPase PilB-like protein
MMFSMSAEILSERLSAVDLLNVLLKKAYAQNASDIHIDPLEADSEVRFRIDGIIHRVFRFSQKLHQELISRIKVLARLRTDIHHAPQDGRFKDTPDRICDVRISIMPTHYGENAVLRLLKITSLALSLDALGIESVDSERIKASLGKKQGMVLVTGPTGSGKTTTLYSLLALVSESNNVVTIEDPIEYAMEGVRQIQINPHHGLSFASGLRAILRQDPDIIMVGEIRDTETASIAIHAALTGHLLFSTLHTQNAVSVIPRLIDMGIAPYLIASTLEIIIAERLVRKLCVDCREKTGFSSSGHSFRATGCSSCNWKGFSGRIGMFEIIVMNDNLRELVLSKAPAKVLQQAAEENGTRPLNETLRQKAIEGIIAQPVFMKK